MTDDDKSVPNMPKTPPPPPGAAPPPPPPMSAADQIARQSGGTQHQVPQSAHDPFAAPARPMATPPAPPQYASAMPPPPPNPAATSGNWKAITGFILGLVGLLVCCGLPVLTIPGLILSHLGLSAANRGTSSLRGLAIAGVIIGWIATVIGLMFFAYFIWFQSYCSDPANAYGEFCSSDY